MCFKSFPCFTSCAQDAEEKEEDDEGKKDEEDEEKKDEEEEEPEEPDEPVRSLYHFHQAIFIYFSQSYPHQVADRPLTVGLAGNSLSILMSTGDGLGQAYVRMNLADK